jgi:hypothetical protein
MNDETTAETREGSAEAVPEGEAHTDETVDTEPEVRESPEASAEATTPQDDDLGDPADDRTLLPADQNDSFRSRWEEIQAGFVDKPQEAVEQADALVVDLMQRVTGGLTTERERLEEQWARGDDVSTEELRVALTRYRTFFDRLLSA